MSLFRFAPHWISGAVRLLPMNTPERTVVVELKIRILRSYPVDWSVDSIEFHLNESSHCIGNEIREIAESDSAIENSCDTCHRTETKYLREATPEDLENLKFRDQPATRVIEIQPDPNRAQLTAADAEGVATPGRRETN
jgi:hypothetical protein